MLIRQVRKMVWCLAVIVFLDNGFKFHANVCNRCHNVLVMSTNLSHIAILKIHWADYRCVISGISKMGAINLLKFANLAKKVEN